MASSTQQVPSAKKLAVKGTIWTILGYGGSQILRFGGNLVLTRLLVPELFGLMAIINIFIIGLNLFSEVGIGLSIVQNKAGDKPIFYNTAWTLQVFRGFLLWISCLILAWPLSNFYDDSRLLVLLPIVGLNTIIAGFNSTALFTMERHMLVRKQVFVELGVQTVNLIVMLIWAFLSPTIWALAIGGQTGSILKMIWSHKVLKNVRNKFILDKDCFREIVSMGRWIFISTALTFAAEQADRLILGKLFAFKLLGIYGIALLLSDVPRQVVIALSGKVIFPSISKVIHQSREDAIIKILKMRRSFLIVLSISMAALVGLGDLIVRMLYDIEYHPAAWMLPILAIGIWPRLLAHTSEAYLFAIAKVKYMAYGNFTRLVATVVGILIGYHYFQVPGAIVAVALNDLLYYIVVTFGLVHEGLNVLLQDCVFTLLFLGLLVILIFLRLSLGLDLPIAGMPT